MSTTTPTSTSTSTIATEASSSTVQAIVGFFAEMVGRLFSKTPAFFKIIQVVSVIVAVVTGLPSVLTSSGISLPPAFTALESSAVAIAGLVSLFISSLPVETVTTTTPTTTTTTSVAAPVVTVKTSS